MSKDTINVPKGYYVVGYLTKEDPAQDEGSRLAIAWLEKHAKDGTWRAVKIDADGTARAGGIEILKPVTDYPLNGNLLYRASATTVQDPTKVYLEDNRTNTAQELARQEAARVQRKVAQKGVKAVGGLADKAAKEVVQNIKDIDRGPNWAAVALGGLAGVVGLFGLYKVLK